MNQAPYYNPGSMVRIYCKESEFTPEPLQVVRSYAMGIEVMTPKNVIMFIPYSAILIIERINET